ncbi:MAG: shikimate kinase [Ferruginibacter sp.]
MTNASDNSLFSQNPAGRAQEGKIFLIGFMGSGKSYWGKKWSRKYQFDFYDLDKVIEHDQQKTIATIFEKEGEEHFRLLETATLQTFSEKDNCLIACGGGTACFNDNMKWMNENGTTVYLSATPQYIYDRIYEEKDRRPLVSKLNQAELFFFIEQKLKEREPFYNQAKITIRVEELSGNFVPGFIISKPPAHGKAPAKRSPKAGS